MAILGVDGGRDLGGLLGATRVAHAAAADGALVLQHAGAHLLLRHVLAVKLTDRGHPCYYHRCLVWPRIFCDEEHVRTRRVNQRTNDVESHLAHLAESLSGVLSLGVPPVSGCVRALAGRLWTSWPPTWCAVPVGGAAWPAARCREKSDPVRTSRAGGWCL